MVDSSERRSISVLLLPTLMSETHDLRQTCSIVIDVLRATSVMATAGRSGATRIHTCQDIAETQTLANGFSRRPLICGERLCKPIEGFDLGNSPAEYSPAVVAGRELILTTTNGTRAINAVMGSRRLLVASFLNLRATVAAIEAESRIQMVCAGTDGRLSGEDVLLAGAIVDRLIGSPEQLSSRIDALDDSARLALAAWRSMTSAPGPLVHSLEHALALSLGGRNLIAAGYAADLQRCALIDTIDGIVQRSRSDQAVFEYQSLDN